MAGTQVAVSHDINVSNDMPSHGRYTASFDKHQTKGDQLDFIGN